MNIKKNANNYIITTGDVDGVGFEVTVKALQSIFLKPNQRLFLFRSPFVNKEYLNLLDRKFKRKTFKTIEEAIETEGQFFEENIIFDICSIESPVSWFEKAIELCLYQNFKGIITGPISKELTYEKDYRPLGHTQILNHYFPNLNLKMAFIGEHFNVLLHSHHIPLKEVTQHLDKDSLKSTIQQAFSFQELLALKNKPISLLGLNPHSGEDGLLGREELDIIIPSLENWPHNLITGPMVPDVAFSQNNWAKFALYIALYHDQGLIPFKLIHGQNLGFQLTLGLPFIRTSVDHGTAKDIFNKNCANSESMLRAIKWTLNSNLIMERSKATFEDATKGIELS